MPSFTAPVKPLTVVAALVYELCHCLELKMMMQTPKYETTDDLG